MTLLLRIALCAGLILSVSDLASAKKRFLEREEAHVPNSSTIFMMVHPSRVWDGEQAAKIGINEAYLAARNHNIDTYLLRHEPLELIPAMPIRKTGIGYEIYQEWNIDDIGPQSTWRHYVVYDHLVTGRRHSYYMDEAPPSYYVDSQSGEHDIAMPRSGGTVILSGGYYEMCQSNAIRHIMSAMTKRHQGFDDITFEIVSDGTYMLCASPAVQKCWDGTPHSTAHCGSVISTVNDCLSYPEKSGKEGEHWRMVRMFLESVGTAYKAKVNFSLNGKPMEPFGSGDSTISVRFITSAELARREAERAKNLRANDAPAETGKPARTPAY